MATKPSTWPIPWCTNLVYLTGPFIGSPGKVVIPAGVAAEGHRPGALFPTAAEYENYNGNLITTALTDWVQLGSSAGAADAHIVETDTSGETQVERARVVPANPNSYALFVQAPPNAGHAVQATGGSLLGDATIIAATTGPGPAIEGQSATAGPCVEATPTGAGPGFYVSVGGTGMGVQIIGGTGDVALSATGGAGQVAVVAVAGNNANAAVVASGTGTSLGVDAGGGTGSAASTAVRGTAQHADAVGVHGRSDSGASTTGTGVTAEGRGSGAGLRAIAAAFHAAIFQGDTTSPLFAAVRFLGANARPLTATAGSLEYVNAENQFVAGDALDNAFRGVWTTTGGKVTAYTASGNAAQNLAKTIGTAIWVTAATCSATNGNAPKVAGREAVLRFRCTARNDIPVAGNYLSVRLYDVTSGSAIPGSTRAGTGNADAAGFYLAANTDAWQAPIVFDFRFTPGTGDRTYRAEIKATFMTEIWVRDCSLTMDGLF